MERMHRKLLISSTENNISPEINRVRFIGKGGKKWTHKILQGGARPKQLTKDSSNIKYIINKCQ